MDKFGAKMGVPTRKINGHTFSYNFACPASNQRWAETHSSWMAGIQVC